VIHGFLGDARSFDDLAISAVRVALPGHGSDPVGSWNEGLRAVAAQIGDVEIVVGYSLGARVALGLVASARAPRAILIGVNPGLVSDEERAARLASDQAWASMVRRSGIAAFLDAWEAQPLFATQARVDPARLAARRARRLRLDPEGIARSLETMGLAQMPDYHAAIASNASRLHLIAGADDARFVAIARALVAECPALPLDLVADSGHDPILEQPEGLSRAITRAITRFVTNV